MPDEKILDRVAFQMLEKHGLPVVRGSSCKSLHELEQKALEIGYPVVIKADANQAFHKSDAGAVQFVFSPSELAEKYKLVITGAEKRVPNIDSVIVQRLVSGKELFIGAQRDPDFGPVIMFGLGGRMVEALDEVATRLIPITERDAGEMLRETRAWALLNSRDPDADKRAEQLTGILLKISAMFESEGLKELDINPIFVTKNGCFIADVRALK